MEKIKEILRSKSLKITNQRLLVAKYLFDGHNKHITAEDLFKKPSHDYTKELLRLMPKIESINV